MRLTRKSLISKIKESNKVKMKHLNIDGNECLFEVSFEYKGRNMFYVKTLVGNVEANHIQKDLIELSKTIYFLQKRNCNYSDKLIHNINGYQIYGYNLSEAVLHSFLSFLTLKNYEIIFE